MKADAAAQTQKLLSALWARNLTALEDRLQLLERAAGAAHTATLTPPLRQQAAATAHKLAGSLGMFGYADGTDIARRLEWILDASAPPDPDQLTALASELRRSLKL